MPRYDYRDPVTGQFTKMPLPQVNPQAGVTPTASGAASGAASPAASEANKTMKDFTSGLKTFTKSLKNSKFGKAAMVAGSAIASGAKSAAGAIQQRANQAGFSKEDLAQDIGMDSPLLQAAAGLTLDAGGALAKGAGKLVAGGFKKLVGSKESGEEEGGLEKATGEAEGGGETDSGLLEKLSEIQVSVSNIEKYMEDSQQDADRARMEGIEASRESLDPSDGTVSPVEKKKSGGGGGMLAGLLGAGGIIGGLFSGAGGGMMKIVTTLFSSIGSVFSGLMGLATKIPMLVSKAMPFLKQGAKFFKQIFKKLFWPVTAILAALEFIDGFIAGYKEGGILEGIKQGFESVINSFIDVPLNMLKDMVAWVAGKLGFENIEESLNSFDVDFSSIVGDGLQFLFDFIADIPNKLKQMFVNFVKNFPGAERFANFVGIDVNAMQEEIDTDRKEKTILREERDKRTAERRAAKAKKDSGVEPTASETSSGTESGLEKQTAKQTAAATDPELELYRELMAQWSHPNGDYYDEETGLTFGSEESYEAAKLAIPEVLHPNETRSRSRGKDVQPASSRRDSRGIAASQIQDAAMAASGGGGSPPIVNVTTTDNSQKKGGTTIVPGTLNTETDPFMSQIANADF